MIQILDGSSGSHKKVDPNAITPPQPAHESISALPELGVRRLVLQPMDARLEYVRDLRVWLRENGWRITQVRPSHTATTVTRFNKNVPHRFVFPSSPVLGRKRTCNFGQGIHDQQGRAINFIMTVCNKTQRFVLCYQNMNTVYVTDCKFASVGMALQVRRFCGSSRIHNF